MNQASESRINIAIDGPAGAGKSTVARKVAEALNYIYIDTGAMYRAVTLAALREGIRPDDEANVIRCAERLTIELKPGDAKQRVYLNGEEVTDAIRNPDVTRNVSRISSIGEVRTLMVREQQRIARNKGVVMDGRDIGTAVLPDAELKVFLTASVEERAARRYKEIENTPNEVPYDQLLREIAARDKADESREISPLSVASDAVVLDSTSLAIPQVIDRILSLAQTRIE